MWSAGRTVEQGGGEPCDSFDTGPGIHRQGAQVPMPALGLQHHRGRSRLGQMRQRPVAQLVQGPAAGMAPELRGCKCGTTAGPGRSADTGHRDAGAVRDLCRVRNRGPSVRSTK